MSTGALIGLLALTGSMAFNAGTVFQVITAIRRKGDCLGVSLTTAGTFTLSFAGWTLYAVSQNLTAAAVGSGIGSTLWLIVAVLVGRHRPMRELRIPAMYAFGIIAVWTLGGPEGLGAMLVADTLITSIPQLWRVTKRSVSGVSVTTWASAGISSAGWLVYGLYFGDMALVISQGARIPIVIGVITIVTARRRRRPDTTTTTTTTVPTTPSIETAGVAVP